MCVCGFCDAVFALHAMRGRNKFLLTDAPVLIRFIFSIIYFRIGSNKI
jgi:hypothetical protein